MTLTLFGKRLEELLNDRKWKHVRFAGLMGVTVPIISHWKHGRSDPSCKHVKMMADIFDVSIDWLFGRTDDKHSHKAEAASTPTDH